MFNNGSCQSGIDAVSSDFKIPKETTWEQAGVASKQKNDNKYLCRRGAMHRLSALFKRVEICFQKLLLIIHTF